MTPDEILAYCTEASEREAHEAMLAADRDSRSQQNIHLAKQVAYLDVITFILGNRVDKLAPGTPDPRD